MKDRAAVVRPCGAQRVAKTRLLRLGRMTDAAFDADSGNK